MGGDELVIPWYERVVAPDIAPPLARVHLGTYRAHLDVEPAAPVLELLDAREDGSGLLLGRLKDSFLLGIRSDKTPTSLKVPGKVRFEAGAEVRGFGFEKGGGSRRSLQKRIGGSFPSER